MVPVAQLDIFQNAVLKSLSPDCLERLRLKPVKLEPEFRLISPEDPVRWLLFIETGSVALSVPLRDGSLVETGIVGTRSIVCAAALLGARESVHQATVRSPGHGYLCSMQDALQEFARAGQFHALALACLRTQLIQASQIAACNRRHDVQQRLCRWLLHCQDESRTELIYATHCSLGDALGVTRTTVTVNMDLLRNGGLMDYSRGRIRLLDRSGLEARACECYEALRKSSGAAKYPEYGLAGQKGPQLVPALAPGTYPPFSADRRRETERRTQYPCQ